METTPHALAASQAGILADIGAAGVMTTGQIRRLRFPGTGRANCRSHLARLRRGGLIERLEGRLTPVREACWRLTASGAATVGRPAPAPGDGDPARIRELLRAAEAYVGEQTAVRLDQFDGTAEVTGAPCGLQPGLR